MCKLLCLYFLCFSILSSVLNILMIEFVRVRTTHVQYVTIEFLYDYQQCVLECDDGLNSLCIL